MSEIHPTAVVEDGARIGADVTIGPYSLIGGQVSLADGVTVDARVIVRGRTTIGPRTRIGPQVFIGGDPQDLSFRGEETAIEIGADCIIRENATVHRGTAHGRRLTTIGNHVFMMVATHVAHDCIIGDHVILTNGVMCGGHSEVGDYAIVGGGAAVQQRIRIGVHAFIGGLSGVDRDVLPYAMANGQRPLLSGINVRGLKRRGFSHADIMALRSAFRLFSGATPRGASASRRWRTPLATSLRSARCSPSCAPPAIGRWCCLAGRALPKMTAPTADGAGEPLAILAAGGSVPLQVAAAARSAGRDVLVIGLEGEADERLQAFRYQPIKWGQLGRIEEYVSAHGAREIVLIGSVSHRPDFHNLGLDLRTLRLLPRILKAMAGGDDAVLGNLIAYLEDRGFRVRGAHEVAPDLVAVAGQLAGPRPSQGALDDAGTAFAAARAIGQHDIGQGAVVVNGLVVAVEAAEGTDAMLERVGTLHSGGRVKWSGRAGVLAKCSKPQQDLRVDMPTIGPLTVAGAVKAGLAGIVVEAGRVMIAERAETLKAAEDSGTFILATAEGTVRSRR